MRAIISARLLPPRLLLLPLPPRPGMLLAFLEGSIVCLARGRRPLEVEDNFGSAAFGYCWRCTSIGKIEK